MRAENFDINKVTEYLEGTCMYGLENAIQCFYPEMKEEDLSSEEFETFDETIFRCEGCGWWCPTEEKDEEGNCKDCSKDDSEQD